MDISRARYSSASVGFSKEDGKGIVDGCDVTTIQDPVYEGRRQASQPRK